MITRYFCRSATCLAFSVSHSSSPHNEANLIARAIQTPIVRIIDAAHPSPTDLTDGAEPLRRLGSTQSNLTAVRAPAGILVRVRNALVLVALTAATSYATPPGDAFVDIVPGAPQSVRALVFGTPQVKDCVLHDGPLHIPAESVTDADPADRVAIVFVWNGQEFARSDDDEWVPNDDDQSPLRLLEKAIDRYDWKQLGPASSTFAIVSYNTGASIVRPMTPLAELKGSAFGSWKDLRGMFGTDLVQGVDLGLNELEHVTAPRKLLVIIGDGNDTNNETARLKLPELAARAHMNRIDTFGIIYKTAIASEGDVLHLMIPSVHTAASLEGIASEFAEMNRRVMQRAIVLFPGDKLAWDGSSHAIAIDCFGVATHTDVVFSAWAPPKPPWPVTRYLVIGAAIAVVLSALMLRRRQRHRDLR
jgi:hypothetical protein